MKKLLVLTVLTSALFSGCTGSKDAPPMDYVPHMFDSPAVKSQHLGPDGEAGRTPPEGTLAVGQETYAYATDAEASSQNKNILPRTKQNILRGQKAYNTYCMVCHGKRGEGNGSIIPKFPPPPTLHSEKVRSWADGRIYHVITMGQNLMPSYAIQVSKEDRWAITHYIRALQRSLNPSAEDLRELERLNK